jgi:hypothetical protein
MPSLAPFGQAVSEEKIFLTLANQKKELILPCSDSYLASAIDSYVCPCNIAGVLISLKAVNKSVKLLNVVLSIALHIPPKFEA